MRNRRPFSFLPIVPFVLLGGPLLAQVNLVTNGSFEQGPDPGPYQATLSAGARDIPGWRVFRGTIDYVGVFWMPSEGRRSIDLEGNDPGGLEQVIATAPGRTYRVVFDLAGNAGSHDIKRMRVNAAGSFADFTFDTTGKSFSNMGWVQKTWSFVANAMTTTLQFESTRPTGAQGAALDNVRVYDVGPYVFPPDAENTEGSAGFPMPFGMPKSRTQCLMEAAGFSGPAGGTIRALELRRDQGAQPFATRQVDLVVLCGFAARDAEHMSTRFADNWAGTPTLVFLGTFSPPAQPAVPVGPAPFAIQIPFGNPVTWNGEDLLYQIDASNNTLSGGYDLDLVVQPFARGQAQALGTACLGPTGKAPQHLLPDAHQLLPGATLVNYLQDATPMAVALNVIGDSTTQWGGVPLPFTWPGTGCTIYTNMVLSDYRIVDAHGAAQTVWPIPDSPLLTGLVAHSQFAVFEGPTAFPPITLTQALRLTIGARLPIVFDTVANLDGSAIGAKYPGSHSVLVTRLVVN